MSFELPPIDHGEAALATIGINAVIADDVPRVGVERMREIGNIGKRIEQKAKALVAGELRGHGIPRPHSYRTLLERLSRGLAPTELQAIVDRFPAEASDISGPLMLSVQHALDYLRQAFPTSEYVTFTGPQQMPPPADLVGAFFLKLQVVNDPLLVFDLAGSAALLQSQAACVKELFPTLSRAITAAIIAATAAAKGAKKSFQLPQRVSMGVANWMGNRVVDFQPAPVERLTPGVKRPNPAALAAISKLQEQQTPQSVGA